MPVIIVTENQARKGINYFDTKCPLCQQSTFIILLDTKKEKYDEMKDSLIEIRGIEYHKECLIDLKNVLDCLKVKK